MTPKDIAIVTSYFNPCRYSTKKLNFDIFARRLESIGARLHVIEMAAAENDFELGDEHEVIRVRGNGLLWQKERLLNIAIATLPASCTKVAWLDCDLLFEDDAWLEKTSAALERFVVVQPFTSCIRLPRGQVAVEVNGPSTELTTESFAAAFARDPSLSRDGLYNEHGHTGFAWAARREFLDACSLYDACLTGSGDHVMAHIFAGKLDSVCIPKIVGSGQKYAQHFERWAVQADRVVRGSLGATDGRVLHLWHGEKADRRYYQRNQEFKQFGFDPEHHIRREENGVWEWAEAPTTMRDWSAEMFASRNEDGA